jgi:hypothetical protein
MLTAADVGFAVLVAPMTDAELKELLLGAEDPLVVKEMLSS